MQYQIQTAPICDAYRRSDGCPLCRIFAERENRLVSQYLAENVMDPDFRVASNSVGFCPYHIRAMYGGQNKLGLALQLETRAAALYELLDKTPADKKSAQKQAEKLEAHIGCVICNALAEPMSRYYMTVAEMFDNEKEFPELFGAAHHCIKHVAQLYYAARFAGKSVSAYLYALSAGIRRDLKQTETDLRAFADCFDFRNSGMRPDPDAVPDAIKLMITPNVK